VVAVQSLASICARWDVCCHGAFVRTTTAADPVAFQGASHLALEAVLGEARQNGVPLCQPRQQLRIVRLVHRVHHCRCIHRSAIGGMRSVET